MMWCDGKDEGKSWGTGTYKTPLTFYQQDIHHSIDNHLHQSPIHIHKSHHLLHPPPNIMTISKYGIAKGIPSSYTFQTAEDRDSTPHLHLNYTTSSRTREAHEAAINIKSGDASESRLVYWTVSDFKHPITDELSRLPLGFQRLRSGENHSDLALDYLRADPRLFDPATGRILPHDEDGPDNDILDQLRPILDRAIEEKAKVYLWGSAYRSGKGIHNVHMNQGSSGRFSGANGIFQDGGFVIEFDDHWEGVFIGFASQAVETDGEGQPMGDETWVLRGGFGVSRL